MVIKHKVQQNSPEWFALREPLITASNAYALLTRGKNACKNSAGGSGSGFWAERGHILEAEALEVYEAVYGVEVERVGFVTNADFPECGYSPDGDIYLEVKCFKDEKHLSSIKDLPIEVICQVQFGMMITELPSAKVILYNPDIEDSSLCFVVIEVPRDERLITRFKKKLEA